ncbi:MAG: methyltransferase domain-containing protein, partial [SAR324 cluster bacterium]|nr:methyltransferase domain-containing protein [SAR324 cluster bacterium]
MNIVFYVPGMPFNGETIAGSSNCEDRSPSTGSGQSLGGSESAGYYLAREMARRGHSVTAFTQIAGHEAGEWEGVRYVPIGPLSREYPFGAEFQRYAGSVPHDVLIGQRVPALFSQTYQSKLNFWWTHDLALRRYLPRIGAQIWNLDGIFAVSRFHKAQVAEVYGIKPEIVHVLRNGIDHALFDRSRDPEAKQAGKKLVYSHRPERGLEHLVRPGGIMAGLAERDPAIRLQVCGYDNTTPEMAPYYEQLRAWATALPNVDWRGALSKGQLAELMCSAWLHVYPTGFQEVSCITAMEEQAAGTPFITNGGAALPETLAGGGVRWIDDLPAGPATLLQAQGRQAQGGAGSGHSPGQGGVDCEAFIRAILSLRDSPGQWRGLHAAALAKAPEYAWGASADALEAVIDETFARRTEQPARMARHLMRTSDIFPLRNYLETLNGEGAADPIMERVGGELRACYGFAFEERYAEHYAAYYAYERERGVTYGPEKLEGNPRFEAVSRRVETLVPAGGRVLDYGCAHGHYSINLAKRFPKVHFTGIDFIPSNIATAQKWAADEDVANVAFREGELNALGEDDLYDLIIAAEVAEHVTAPAALVDTLTEHLKPEGRLLLTTPYGPWEAQGFAEHHPWRAHVHHLEEADLRELFGHHPGFALQAVPAGHTPWGEALGSYVTTFRRPEGVGGRVDLGRKFKRQAPRETLSVCMIVKADGDTLAKCLRSVGEVADEIIIGVDMGENGPSTLRPFDKLRAGRDSGQASSGQSAGAAAEGGRTLGPFDAPFESLRAKLRAGKLQTGPGILLRSSER